MKTLLVLLMLVPLVCIRCNVNKQAKQNVVIPVEDTGCHSELAIRLVAVGVDSFSVEYEYCSNEYMSPAVARFISDSDGSNWREDTAAYRLDRHYYASISVYKILNKNKQLIGETFGGYYTAFQCYEDNPIGFVQKAQYLQSIIDSNKVSIKRNGEYAVYKYVVTWTEFDTGLDSGGLVIDKIPRQRDFLTNKEAHDFIDKEIIPGSGVDITFDSVLITQRFKRLMTREEYSELENNRYK